MSRIINRCNSVKLFTILVFLIYPFAALPLIFIEIYNGKRYAYTLLAIYIGFFALLYPPAGDLYRYREDYLLYKNESFSTFITLLALKLDFILSFLLYLLSNLNVSCDFARFIYTWIGSELLLHIFYDMSTNYRRQNPKRAFILFLIYWLYLNFIVLMYRHGLSSAFFAYGYYCLYYRNKKGIAGVMFILAILNHFSYIVFVAGIIFQRLLKFEGNKWISLACILFFLFCSFDMISSIIEKLPLPDYIQKHLLAYTNGFWAQEFLETQSLKNMILTWTNKFRLISLFSLYILYYQKSNVSGFLTIATIILMLSNVSATISARFEIAMLLPFLIFCFDLVITQKISRYIIFKKAFMYIGMLYLFTSFWSHRREYSISQEYKIFLPTSYNILSSTYSQTWVDSHIDSKGEPIGLY